MQSPEVPIVKKKPRRIVVWTSQEDDILREQIGIHGTENWSLIASNFNGKSTRQCRRRWYTYLNSDFKKGGWTPEEDTLLCEAQRRYGNRWTEIAKVVSGRTDNAVKNRFTTLCKKRARLQALTKENNSSTYINVNNKRVFSKSNGFQYECSSDVASPNKRLRIAHIPNVPGCSYIGDVSDKDYVTGKQQSRHPLTVLRQNNHQNENVPETLVDGNRKIEGTFMKKDDPKKLALMQQAELLSSLAMKVKTENTEQSLDNASEALENFLNEKKDNKVVNGIMSEMDLTLDEFNEMFCELNGIQPSDTYDSPSGSEYSTESSILSMTASEQMELTQSEICTLFDDDKNNEAMLQTVDTGGENTKTTTENKILTTETTNQDEILVPCTKTDNEEEVSALSIKEFSSPLFRSSADAIPSPQFSESERHFLMKTLGIESPAPNKTTNPSQPHCTCRRALVHSL